MKVFAVATILAAAVSAAPTKDLFPFPIGPIPSYGVVNSPNNGGIPPVTSSKREDSSSCPVGLYSNPQCCSTDILGDADLDCSVPSSTPEDGADFRAICAAAGKQANCCAIPVASQNLLCQKFIGAN